MYKSILLLAISAAVICNFAHAVVPDPQIMTDHPVYRGELSCSTLDRNIAEAYRIFAERFDRQPQTETEKLVALFSWKAEHYMHNCDPYVYVGPDHPEAREGGWFETRDSQMGQFSFGFSLCYTVHAQLSALVGHALGDRKKTRCPNVPGHTPFEAFVDGKWALADITTGMMVFDDQGRPMSIAEIMPYANADDTEWMNDPRRGGFVGLTMVPFGDNWDVYKKIKAVQMLYGYNAMPIVYSLRSGETFTRYLDPGLEDGETWVFWGQDYWDHRGAPRHGPYRNVTFLDAPPIHNSRGRGHAFYGNGIFEYTPPLADGRYRQGVWSQQNVVFDKGALRASADRGEVVFEHTSPYIICARSAKGGDRVWDIRHEECLDGAIVSGRTTGPVRVAVSVDAGRSWQHIGAAAGNFTIDFTDLAKGRHGYLIRFALTPDAGLAHLKLRTVTLVSRAVFPRLKDGGTTVTYQAGNQTVIHGGPSHYLSDRFRQAKLDGEGYRFYRITAPGPLRHVAGAARCSGPDRGPWSVAFSLDGGKTWKFGMKPVTLAEKDSDWGGGRHAYPWGYVDLPDNDANEVLIRFGKGNVLHAQVYATYQQPTDSALEVTYAWTEGGKLKQHTHKIDAPRQSDTWTVPTVQDVVSKWVRFSAE